MVKQGYKQTEIGVIPEDWEVKKINDISNPVRGGSPRPAGSPLFFNGNYIPWLTVASLTNISNSKIYVDNTESMLTELGSNYSRRLEKDTLIISNSGATLGVAKLLGIECCANDGIAALLDLKADNKFLVYYINSLTEYLRNNVATGNGQPNLNTDLIGNLSIPLPPLAEQEAIATALSDADAWIESLEQLIAKKRLIKQGAMQELLTPKEDWEVKKLGEVGKFQSGWGFPIIYQGEKNGNIPFFKVSDLNNLGNEKFLTISNNYISENTSAKISKELIKKRSIVFAKIGAAVFLERKRILFQNSLIDNNMCSYYTDNIDSNYLYYYFLNINLSDFVSTSALPSLSTNDLNQIQINYPKSLSEQTRIATILSDMDAEIEALEQKLSKVRQIKQGMMQELLTGRIRLL